MTRSKKKLGITGVLLMSFLIFTVVIIILLWVFQIVLLNNFYRSITTKKMKAAANTLSANIDNPDIDDLAVRMVRDGEIAIKVIYFNGAAGISAYAPNDVSILRTLPDMDLYELYRTADENGGSYLKKYERRAFHDLMYNPQHFHGDVPKKDSDAITSMVYVLCAGNEDGGSNAVIFIGAKMQPVDATADTLKIQLVWVTVIMTVLSLILAILLARRISKPIVKLNSSAKALAHGNYDAAFSTGGYREIRELGSTLDTAAKELGKVDSLKNELIANISHDLRTPLTLIEGYAEVMRDIPGENNGENVQVIIDEAQRLSALITDILDLSRLRSGSVELNIEPFCLTDTIGEIIGRYSKFVARDGFKIIFEPTERVTVKADEIKISQVLYNLVGNAVNYTGEDKTVIIRQLLDKNTVTVEVSDSGEGIDPDKLENVWERYYKISETHKRSENGSGLGLSIVKGILDMHNAQYSVTSEKNKGTTFSFTLQAYEDK